MVRIGLLGCGRIGAVHAGNLAHHPEVEFAVVYDPHQPAAERVGTQHGVAIAESAEALLRTASLDGVVIASATPTHSDYIEAAVDNGLAVLCEKPIDLELARVNQCAQRIGERADRVQIGFNRRFDPGHRAACEAAHSGNLGKLLQVNISSRDPDLPPLEYRKVSGGIFRDMTIHDFDVARWVFGEEPQWVHAAAHARIAPEENQSIGDFDSAMVILETSDGKLCHIGNSRLSASGYDQRLEILGAEGSVISDNRTPHECRRFDAHGSNIAPPHLNFFIERYAEAYRAELDAFVRMTADNTPAPVGFEDGRQALILAEAAYLSLRAGNRVNPSDVPGYQLP